MNIKYYHSSIYGNGAMVADEFKKQMDAKGVMVNIHNIRDVKPKEIPPADFYIFSSPGRFGKPPRNMQNFIKRVNLPPGTKYAVLVTELCPNPESSTERIPSEDKAGSCQKVLFIINQILGEKGLIKINEGKVFVTGIKGPLEEGWQKIVEEFASQIPVLSDV